MLALPEMNTDREGPWKKVILLFIIFILLIGCTNTPRLRNDEFITAWTIVISIVGLCIGVIFSMVLRSLAKSMDDRNSTASSEGSEASDIEAALPVTLPPSYQKCCPKTAKSKKSEKGDGLPSYLEAVAVLNEQQKAAAEVHKQVQKF